jgi:GntR family transcriptional regulator
MTGTADAPLLSAATRRYDAAARRIEEEICKGNPAAGERLLSERDLSRVLGVSRVTVRRALAALKARGVVASDETRGWFVTEAVVAERNLLRSFTEFARQRGLVPGSRVLARRCRPAQIAEAEIFAAGEGEEVFEVTRLRLMAGEPIAIETSRVPLRLCPGLVTADLAQGSLHALLRAAGCGPVRADYALTAVTADAGQADLLGVAGGSALLSAEAIARDARNRVVEMSSSLFRADRYVFSTTLRSA